MLASLRASDPARFARSDVLDGSLAALAHLTSTAAPASSSLALAASAASLVAFSRTGFGAASTRSLASFRPRLVSSRTTLMTWIFWAPASVRTTSNSSFSSSTGAAAPPPPPAAAATATGAAAVTPKLLLERVEQLLEFEDGECGDPVEDLVLGDCHWSVPLLSIGVWGGQAAQAAVLLVDEGLEAVGEVARERLEQAGRLDERRLQRAGELGEQHVAATAVRRAPRRPCRTSACRPSRRP